mgnify:FL=1
MAITPTELTNKAFEIAKRFSKVNTFYLKMMAKQIKAIGKLDKDNLHRLEQLALMGNNIKEINSMLVKETGLALEDIQKLYLESAGEEYKDAADLYNYKGVAQPPFSKNKPLNSYIESVKKLTDGTFINMSHTTAISKDYRDIIDLAIDTVATGMDDYESVMKRMLLSKARKGMRITYASGRTRRLESACRMNILEGVRQVNNGIRKEMGNQYGADGVEIDAHGLCAEDHLPYQGRQYTIKAYEKLNDKLKRPIGTLNCRHGISYIILGVSPKTYTKEDLELMKKKSTDKVTIKGKEYTKYEASQLMRSIETEMRYKKDEIIALDSAGFDYKKQETKLGELKSLYYHVAKKSGITPRFNRTYVYGYDED